MIKHVVWLFTLVSIVLLSACANTTNSSNFVTSQPVPSKEINETGVDRVDTEVENAAEESAAEVSEVQSTKIKMTVDGEEIIATMYDNPTSQDFMSRIPLTLTFEDHNRTEKISYLPNTLTTEEAPDGFDLSEGDLTLYTPWGNLAIFYNDFTYSNGLISLGHIDSGIDKLRRMNGEFTVTVEALD